MYATRHIQLLVAVVSVFCMVQAAWWDTQKIHRGLIQRAGPLSDIVSAIDKSSKTTDSTPTPTSDANAGSTTITDATPTSSSTSSSTQSTDTPSSTSGDSESSTSASKQNTAATTSPTDGSSTTSSSSNPTPTSAPEATSSGSGSDSGDGNATPATTPAPASTEVQVVTMTNSDGSTVVQTSTTKTTPTAALDSADSQPSGMTTKTRNTIIGAVVGVGGAAVLGALGLVAFRLWGRRKHAEEAAGLMDYNADVAEKTPRGSSGGGQQRNLFQSTLENYHRPTPINASSNF